MADPLFWLVALPPLLGFALVAIYAGYVAYETAKARERRAVTPALPDPVTEYARLNAEIAEAMGRARRTLEETRATLQKGIRG